MDYIQRSYSENEIIFSEGEIGNSAYILKSGIVEISVKSNNKKRIISTLTPVTILGEMALLLNCHTRTATATAIEHCELIEITKEVFDGFISQSPPFISLTLRVLVDKLNKATMLIKSQTELL
ncbi:MAG: cyclic nucleotide-binding domain-containing protein [Nitrospirae bacterium YQR-1]